MERLHIGQGDQYGKQYQQVYQQAYRQMYQAQPYQQRTDPNYAGIAMTVVWGIYLVYFTIVIIGLIAAVVALQ